MIDSLAAAIGMVLDWQNFFWALFGVTFGIIMGAIPGLSDNMAIVLLLPFTYYLGPIPGIAMLMGLSKGSNFGGSIPAILFNIPGTPQAMITTFDGYPLAKAGKSGKALKTALFASVTADTASDLVLMFLAAPVAAVALRIGPPEYSMILLFSLVLISLAASSSPCRGLIATALGILFSTVGCDPESGTPRFNFGFIELSDGINIMPMAIGLLVSIFQTITSIQEQTLTFVPKLLGIFLILILIGNWMMNNMVELTQTLWHTFSYYVHK